VQTFRLSAIGRPRAEVALNAGPEIAVSAASVGGESVTFTHADEVLRIALARPAAPGTAVELTIRYSATSKMPNGSGLTWTDGNPKGRNDTDKAAQIHSQGQAESNREWFPCHDSPNERMTTELIVTVEDGYTVGSNGRLVGTTLGSRAANGTPRTRWHWLQDKPHAAYLVSLIVGKFAIVGLPADVGPGSPGGVPCYLYAPLGEERTAARVYAKTPAILAAFERAFGEPYPWDKYSQAIVRRFAPGGMENTSATTMHDMSLRVPWEDVIAHEASHQWTGDLLTCKTWEHVWLNEGWATYSEAIWAEAAAPEGRAKRNYQRKVASFITQQRIQNAAQAPESGGMVSRRWGDPMDAFMRADNPYSKGGVVLHMLRQKLGDELFFAGVRRYIDRYKLKEVETDDFRRCLEEVSGLDLEQFFSQWCYRPGLPRLQVGVEWTAASAGESADAKTSGGELAITIKQTQHIDGDNPAYRFSLPVVLKRDGGDHTVLVDVDSRQTVKTIRLERPPEDVVIDPEMTVAAPTRVKKSLAMWIRQLHDSSQPEGSAFAQAQALAALAEKGRGTLLALRGLLSPRAKAQIGSR
jgi:aminopeptidase N